MADEKKRKGTAKPKKKGKEKKSKKIKSPKASYSMMQLTVAIFFWIIFLPLLTVAGYVLYLFWKMELQTNKLMEVQWISTIGNDIFLLTYPLSVLFVLSLAYLFVLIQNSVANEKLTQPEVVTTNKMKVRDDL